MAEVNPVPPPPGESEIAAPIRRPGLFEATVSAICYEIAGSQNVRGTQAESPPYNDITAFVLGQWRRMPRFLAWPVWIATMVFALGALPQGALFHRLPLHGRSYRLESWRLSRLGPRRSLVRFYRSLALLAVYSRPERPATGECRTSTH
jgi:hypothetical protein